jgi:FAD synthase
VVQGDHLGHQLGFPTANLDVTELLLPPPRCVRCSRVCRRRNPLCRP